MRCLEEGRMLIVSNLIERPDERLDAVILRHYLVEDGETKVRLFSIAFCFSRAVQHWVGPFYSLRSSFSLALSVSVEDHT